MIASITGGSGFGGCVGYCMGDGAEQKKAGPEAAAEKQAPADPAGKRVLWSETRNLPTNDPRRGARMMEATARDAAMLKKLAGVPATGRKLRKPVTHYSLNWAQDEKPTRAEMRQAADASLARLGLAGHQAVLVAHGDTKHPHLHVIVNRVDPSNGRAADLWQSKATLSKWALQYEQQRGKIRCMGRVRNRNRRWAGERVRGTDQGKGRYHRAKPRIRRQTKAADAGRIEQVAWWRAEERKRYDQALLMRGVSTSITWSSRHREDWRGIYQRHRGEGPGPGPGLPERSRQVEDLARPRPGIGGRRRGPVRRSGGAGALAALPGDPPADGARHAGAVAPQPVPRGGRVAGDVLPPGPGRRGGPRREGGGGIPASGGTGWTSTGNGSS